VGVDVNYLPAISTSDKNVAFKKYFHGLIESVLFLGKNVIFGAYFKN